MSSVAYVTAPGYATVGASPPPGMYVSEAYCGIMSWLVAIFVPWPFGWFVAFCPGE
eukprot:SAG22_NODE_8915_length_621_cov_1.365900_1_plen_56_part_00